MMFIPKVERDKTEPLFSLRHCSTRRRLGLAAWALCRPSSVRRA